VNWSDVPSERYKGLPHRGGQLPQICQDPAFAPAKVPEFGDQAPLSTEIRKDVIDGFVAAAVQTRRWLSWASRPVDSASDRVDGGRTARPLHVKGCSSLSRFSPLRLQGLTVPKPPVEIRKRSSGELAQLRSRRARLSQ